MAIKDIDNNKHVYVLEDVNNNFNNSGNRSLSLPALGESNKQVDRADTHAGVDRCANLVAR